MKCPKCGSENINIQSVAITKTRSHGVGWWTYFLLIGWMLWLMFFLPMLIIKLIKGKKVETQVKTVGVCQNCGHQFNI